NDAVTRQLNALQAVADVEWGLNSTRLLSSSTGPYVGMRARVQPFRYFWESREGMVDAFIRESGAYRNAVEGGAAPEAALALLRKNREFITALRTEKTRLQSGFVAMDPGTGQIKAWVGSRDFQTDQFDHVARAQRQPGSIFKPFVYGAALAQGMSPDRQYIDRAVAIPLGRGEFWRPTDGGAPSGRPMTAGEGLMYSKNTITAQIMQEVTPRKTADLARKMGVRDSKLDPVYALALGTSPVTALEMVAAYGTIANGGEYRKPVLVTRIANKSGKVLATFEADAERALSADAAESLLDMLRGVIDHGTGQAIRTRFGIQADVAGKTGTTQNNTDGWFMLMHPQLVVGSWVGFNDARVTMRSNYWGQGAHNALSVVGDFFRQTLNRRLIDASVRFEDQRTGLRPMINQLDKWLDWLGRQKPHTPLPAPVPALPPVRELSEPATTEAEQDRIMEQAWEEEQNRERSQRRPVPESYEERGDWRREDRREDRRDEPIDARSWLRGRNDRSPSQYDTPWPDPVR
ncbi:MAG: hypothetical protein H7315_01315, partial [Herminiimonas sp.]|nr:hypothetical protein [Herminiimonas sp.]